MKTLSENPPEGFQYESGLAEAYHTPPNSKVQLNQVDFGIPGNELEFDSTAKGEHTKMKTVGAIALEVCGVGHLEVAKTAEEFVKEVYPGAQIWGRHEHNHIKVCNGFQQEIDFPEALSEPEAWEEAAAEILKGRV
jgi:hypothetical protein